MIFPSLVAMSQDEQLIRYSALSQVLPLLAQLMLFVKLMQLPSIEQDMAKPVNN